ncbi:hypothetical protein BS17DRAFT_782559 [Gyrodon lividus]|nr:hypothetical protein BS17DRAFT_782559 [Gyrodon lividus]
MSTRTDCTLRRYLDQALVSYTSIIYRKIQNVTQSSTLPNGRQPVPELSQQPAELLAYSLHEDCPVDVSTNQTICVLVHNCYGGLHPWCKT